MKKIIAMLLAIVMVCALSVSAFAAVQDNLDDATQNITVTYSKPANGDVYNIDIAWTNTAFTFTQAADVWNPTNFAWDVQEDGEWSHTAATVTVTNRSTKPVDATITVDSKVNTVTATGNTTLELAGGVGTTEGYEKSANITIDGYLLAAPADNIIAAVTIELADHVDLT